MKKIICFAFPEAFGFGTMKRLAFKEGEKAPEAKSDEDKQAAIDQAKELGKHRGRELKGFEEELEDFDTTLGQEDLDKQKTAALDKLNKEATSYKEGYVGEEEGRSAYVEAIEKARATAESNLNKAFESANKQLTDEGEKESSQAKDVLEEGRKADVKEQYGESDLKTDDFPFNSSRIAYVNDEGEAKTKGTTGTHFRDTMIEMVRSVYVAEGKAAADELLHKLQTFKKDHGKDTTYKNMIEDDAFAFLKEGVDRKIITFEPDNGDKRAIVGKVYGLIHAADSETAFSGDKADAAREKYKAYLAKVAKDCADGKSNPDEILTPGAWLRDDKEGKEFASANAKLDENAVNQQIETKVDSVVDESVFGHHSDQRFTLKGILMARLKNEPDAKKWDDIIKSTMSDVGVSKSNLGAEYDEQSGEKMAKYIEEHAVGVKELKDAHSEKATGYVAGLMLAAEDKFKDKPELLQKYKDSVEAMLGSKDFLDSDADGKSVAKRLTLAQAFVEDKKFDEGFGKESEAIFEATRKLLPTPDKFFKENAEKEKGKDPRDKYVDDQLKDVTDPAKHDRLKGLMMASLGPNKDPEKMEGILKKMGVGADMSDDDVNNILLKDKDYGENGKKLDETSKAYISGLVHRVEQLYKDKPEFVAAYKADLIKSLNEDGSTHGGPDKFKSDTEDLIEELRDNRRDAERGKMSKEDRERSDAEIRGKLFSLTRRSTVWPEDFYENKWVIEQERGKKSEETEKEEKHGKSFLDKHKEHAGSVEDAQNAVDDMFKVSAHPELVSEAWTTAMKNKLEEYKTALGKTETVEGRLRILASARDYLDHFESHWEEAPSDSSDHNYENAARSYSMSSEILRAEKDDKSARKYLTDLAVKQLGFKAGSKEVKDALAALKNAKDDQSRQDVLVAQILALKDNAAADKKENVPFSSADDFNYYRDYQGAAPSGDAKNDVKTDDSTSGDKGDGGGGNGGVDVGGNGGGGVAPQPKPVDVPQANPDILPVKVENNPDQSVLTPPDAEAAKKVIDGMVDNVKAGSTPAGVLAQMKVIPGYLANAKGYKKTFDYQGSQYVASIDDKGEPQVEMVPKARPNPADPFSTPL